jgi:hypothetical protein
VVNSGEKQCITILNRTDTQAVCGIGYESGPFCAFPLYGKTMELIKPLGKVLLLYATVPAEVGEIVEVAYGPGILINCSATGSRDVTYAMNGGWSWGGQPWAESIEADADLVPLLIQYSEELARAAAEPEAGGF